MNRTKIKYWLLSRKSRIDYCKEYQRARRREQDEREQHEQNLKYKYDNPVEYTCPYGLIRKCRKHLDGASNNMFTLAAIPARQA
ncbi:MAG: hypothetical protein PHC31_05370 [Clostridia bacterium]|nr:hypothetical protein [Clostridia bacterium]MDD3971330.1 hypothetical protein [Clostridia bacterium]